MDKKPVPTNSFTHTSEAERRGAPALRPGHGRLVGVPLGRSPFLHHLRGSRRTVTVVRRFSGTMRLSDFPLPCIPAVSPGGFPGRTSVIYSEAGCGISRFPCIVFAYMPRSATAQSPDVSRDNDTSRVAFRTTHGVGTLEFTSISRLNT